MVWQNIIMCTLWQSSKAARHITEPVNAYIFNWIELTFNVSECHAADCCFTEADWASQSAVSFSLAPPLTLHWLSSGLFTTKTRSRCTRWFPRHPVASSMPSSERALSLVNASATSLATESMTGHLQRHKSELEDGGLIWGDVLCHGVEWKTQLTRDHHYTGSHTKIFTSTESNLTFWLDFTSICMVYFDICV